MGILNPRIIQLRCVRCGQVYAVDPEAAVCESCGLEGILDVDYDLGGIPRGQGYVETLSGRSPNHWRYAELLPITPENPGAFLRVGMTPVYAAPRLGRALGIAELYIKDDGLNPTASFKDRASAMGVVLAARLGRDTIACASTGNAASSLAGMAAFQGLKAVILVPARAPAPKVAQLRMFGARVLRVEADYSRVWELCQSLVERSGWYNRNCAVNPWLVEGKKTAGLEIGEQMAGQVVDWVAVSVGDGCTIAGIAKGLRHMVALGVLSAMPRMLGVQAAGAAALYRDWRGESAPETAVTFADSICVSAPRNRIKGLDAVRHSSGAFVVVEDEAIRHAMRQTPRLTGVFAEPAAAATVAGVARAVETGVIQPGARVVAVITGNGLKDIASAQETAGDAPRVAPNLEAIAEALVSYPT